MPRTVTEWLMAFLVLIAIACGMTGILSLILIALGLAMVTIAIGIWSYREVPSKPDPMVAMPDILEYRYPVVLKEGPVFLMPMVEDMRLEKIEPIKVPFKVDDVRTSLTSDDGATVPGGSVLVEGLLVIKPDYIIARRFRLFLDNGGREEVKARALALLAKEIRDKGGEMSWEEIAVAKYVFTAKLIAMLTGLTPPDTQDKALLKAFTDGALEGGQADIKELGVTVVSLDITGIKPEGTLKKFADSAVGEHLQRVAEKADMKTANEMVMIKLEGMGYTQRQLDEMPADKREALIREIQESVQVERGRATKTVLGGSSGRKSDQKIDAVAVLNTNPHQKPSDEGTEGE